MVPLSLVLFLVWPLDLSQGTLPPTCDSQVFCTGPLLHDVMMSSIFSDPNDYLKHLKLKYPEVEVVAKYESLRQKFGGTPPDEEIEAFIEANFEPANDLHSWEPSDFKLSPALMDRVSDPLYKAWVSDLNQINLNLSVRVDEDVKVNPDRYSLIYVPNGFVIAGGMFQELYYWDTHWIIQGLLLLDMPDTVRGILDNFLYLVRRFGSIPNGTRWYYVQRSQPPLLMPMVDAYYEHTHDLDFLRENIETLEKEFNFWIENRMVCVKKDDVSHCLARYFAPSSGPRAEGYRNDYLLASTLGSEMEKTNLYINIKSTCESGHDFSSRWFIKDGTNSGNLTDLETMHIIPVDLNAFLQQNARLLSKFYTALGNSDKANFYDCQADDLLKAIDAILWNEGRGMWLDYDLINHKPRDYFYMSNFAPLWTRSYGRGREHQLTSHVLAYLEEYNIADYPGGMPTSLNNTGEQWDFPNAWPPLQAILIFGLDGLGTQEAEEVALSYAQKWLRVNYLGYQTFHHMFEKYDVTQPGRTGYGGEYEAQTGFGWTNGVVLQLLAKYGRVATYRTPMADHKPN